VVEQFLAAEADVVIEAIGGINPALRIAEAALRARSAAGFEPSS